MSETMEVALRDADVYRFSYSEESRQRWRTDPHWCFDGQLVVRDGRLCDTYWGFDAGDPRIVKPSEGTLTYVCNLGEVRDIQEHETRWYDAADIFNLTHHHGYRKRFVVKKDAVPSFQRMLEEVAIREREVRERMESAVRSAASDLLQLGGLRAKLEAGDMTRKPWW
jgi:hypothetical protein